MNSHIIFVPGKNPKPLPELHRNLLWRTLHEGVRRVDESVALELDFSRFHLVAWNHLFYGEYRDASIDMPWIDALIAKSGPTELEIREAHSWKMRINRVAMSFGDKFPPLVRLLPEEIVRTANEIDRYFSNTDQMADRIRLLLKKQLRPLLEAHSKVLLIGHSLGSVIAYDTLWELSQEEDLKGQVDLLTLGSPLGMKFIFNRLYGVVGDPKTYPKNIRHWDNVSAHGDIVALNRKLRKTFQDMVKHELVHNIEDHYKCVYNHFRNDTSLNFHRSYGYLINPSVGRLIAKWWRAPEFKSSAVAKANNYTPQANQIGA